MKLGFWACSNANVRFRKSHIQFLMLQVIKVNMHKLKIGKTLKEMKLLKII